MKFIHAADIHLDSPLLGLERYEGAPVELMRGSTRRALENLVELALQEKVRLVLIAGDVYDGDWKDHSTGLFFVGQMRRLVEAGIRVFLIRGNHDAASQVTRQLRLPEGVHQFDHKKPGSVVIDDLGLAVHGQSFAHREVPENLAAGYPDPVKGCINIGLLHTSADGRPGHEPYAPCKPAELMAKGYDYWALGHVHEREVLGESPWVVFPGNVQGRSVRELGAKGCTLVTVDGGEITAVEHRDLDVARWAIATVDASGAGAIGELADRVRERIAEAVAEAEGRVLAIRLEMVGVSELCRDWTKDWEQVVAECRSVAGEFGEEVWLEKVRNRMSPGLSTASIEPDGSAWSGVQHFLTAAASHPELLEESVAGLAGLSRQLDSVDLDVNWARDALPEVQRILAGALVEPTDEEVGL
jgi:DNA repair exonuclease SbcCD nuclease subunit